MDVNEAKQRAEINGELPAFPSQDNVAEWDTGMSKREHMATQFMKAMLSRPFYDKRPASERDKDAIAEADALLYKLAKTGGE